MHILIIEDEVKLAKGLAQGLEKEGYAVDYIADGEKGERHALINRDMYDCIILDLMLPSKDGSEICKNLRSEGVQVPILVLTAKDETSDKIDLLDLGADDYLVKPFSFEELTARVRALTRRPDEALPTVLQVGDITLDPAKKKVRKGDKEVPLTLKEFMLLEYMMRNKNRVLSREQIYSHVWDFADDSFSNTIDVHVKNIRKKIDARKEGNLLETVRGIGYRLKDTR